ncbi:MAG: hypothetical protein ACLGIJ_11025 [Candidatus Limnocylindria bacterium]
MTLSASLRRASTGLLIYGAVGLMVAALGLVALGWVSGRVGGLAARTSVQVDGLVRTLEASGQALRDAGTTSVSFAVTLERTPPSVRQAAATVATLESNLRSIASQLDGISILGTRPLGQVSAGFTDMASDLDGLDTRLDLIATDLDGNSDALLANAASLRGLGAELDAIAADLRAGIVQDSFDDVSAVLTVLALALVLVTALPAVGALAFGWWLRRTLEFVAPEGPGGPAG